MAVMRTRMLFGGEFLWLEWLWGVGGHWVRLEGVEGGLSREGGLITFLLENHYTVNQTTLGNLCTSNTATRKKTRNV
mgnify:CR=1 FL=1